MRSSLVFPLAVFGIPLGCALMLVYTTGFDGLYGQDAYAYLSQAQRIGAWLHHGGGWGEAHFPQGYPFSMALIGVGPGGPLLAARLLSIVAITGAALLVHRELRTMASDEGGNRIAVYALLSITCSPFLLRSSQVVMADASCILLLVAGYSCVLRFTRGASATSAFFAAVCVAVAFFFRYASAPIGLVLGVWLVISAFQQRRPLFLWSAALPALAAMVLLLSAGGEGALGHPWLRDWSPVNFFRRSFSTADGSAHYALPNALNVLKVIFHPGFLALGPVLILLFRRRDLKIPAIRLAALCAAVYLIFLMGPPYQNERFLLLAQPFLAIALFPAFLRLCAAIEQRGRRPALLLSAFAVGQLALFVPAMQGLVKHTVVEQRIAAAVNVRPERTVYSFSISEALRVRCPDRDVVELWGAPVERFMPGALVVFNPGAFAEQWKGMDPMLNWQRALDQGAETQVQWPDGWVLARIP